MSSKDKQQQQQGEPETAEQCVQRLAEGKPYIASTLPARQPRGKSAKPEQQRKEKKRPARASPEEHSELNNFPTARADSPKKKPSKYGQKQKSPVVGKTNPYARMETAQSDALKQAEQAAAERAAKSRR